MTADSAGKVAIDGMWGTLRKLRDQWFLLVFLAGALMWARDTWRDFAPLPAIVAAQTTELAAIGNSVARLEKALVKGEEARHQPVFAFPGNRHRIGDARAGAWTAARLVPTRPLRPECRTVALNAWLIDSDGRWFTVETSLDQVPRLEDDTELAFGVLVHADAALGRAQLLVELTHDCGTHRQVQAAPRLHFRVTEG